MKRINIIVFLSFIIILNFISISKPSEVIATDSSIDIKELQMDTIHLLSLNKKENLNELIDLSFKRKEKITSLLEKNDKSVLSVLIQEKIYGNLPASIQQNIEHQINIKGTLLTAVIDDFKNHASSYLYTLKTNTDEYKVFAAGRSETDGPLAPSESSVELNGFLIDKNIIVSDSKDAFKISANVNNSPVLGTVSTKKVIYLLINGASDPQTPFTPDDLRKRAFTDIDSVANFYKEASFGQIIQTGKVRSDGDVFGWLTINDADNPSDNTIISRANSAAQASGISLSGYNNIVYVVQSSSKYSASRTWGYMPGTVSMINYNPSDNTFLPFGFGFAAMHEEGHNYGEHHSNIYICKDSNGNYVSISTNCISYEYGDQWDIMGTSPELRQFNGYHKGRLGYLTTGAPNTVDVPAANGSYTYDITPIEQNSASPQIIRIPRDATNYYYLTYRQPIGYFDVNGWSNSQINTISNTTAFRGITIQLNPNYSTLRQSWLISANPGNIFGGVPNYSNAPLLSGQTFIDALKNITIKTLSTSSTSARVEITRGTPSCIPIRPTVIIDPQSQYGQRGESLLYNITITNNNDSNCGSGDFSFFISRPGEIFPNIYSNIVNVPPGTTKTIPIQMYSLPNTSYASGAYNFTLTVTDQTFSSSFVSLTGTYIVYENTTSDTIKPFVFISTPSNGSYAVGDVNIIYNGGDYSGVSKVEVYKNDQIVYHWTYVNPILNSFSQTYVWNTAGEPYGSYTFIVKMYDPFGNVGISYPIVLNTVPEASPPPSPTPVLRPGDINSDGVVNILDFTILSNAFGTSDLRSDLNTDGIVNILDFTILSNNF